MQKALYGQSINLDIHNTSLNDCIKQEEAISSLKIPNKSNYVSLRGNIKPIKYLRKERTNPDLIVSYSL